MQSLQAFRLVPFYQQAVHPPIFLHTAAGMHMHELSSVHISSLILKCVQHLPFGWLIAKKQEKLERSSGNHWPAWAIEQTPSEAGKEFSSPGKTGSKGSEKEAVKQSEKRRLLLQSCSMRRYCSLAVMCLAYGCALLQAKGNIELQDSRACIKYKHALAATAIYKSQKAGKKKQEQLPW